MDCQNIMMTLYAIRNKDGKWFHSKGHGGNKATWVDSLIKANLYPKIGQAKSRVSYFANNYPEYGVMEIVELYITTSKVIDETKKVNELKNSKSKKEAERAKKEEEYAKKVAEWKLDQARIKFEMEQKTVHDI